MAGGRPPTPIGSFGDIRVRKLGVSRFEACARYRDQDGKLRPVARRGATRAEAERKLKEALADRVLEHQGEEVKGSTTVQVLSATWLAEVEANPKLANSTKLRYATIVESFVDPKLGNFRVREISIPLLDRVLREVTSESGPGIAKGVKSCLSGMFALAVRHGAMASNPVRDVRTISVESAPARALTHAEEKALQEGLSGHLRARRLDLVDLVTFMLGTGVRIGEACALRLDRVDLEAGTAEISRTVGPDGIEDRTKTKAGWRVIALPDHIVKMIKRRIDNPDIATDVAVFPSPLGKVQNLSNLTGRLREVLDEVGFDWVRSHTFRKTVATRLDEAGQSARQVADHLGHAKPSMTLDVYMGRKVASADAAAILGGQEAA